MNHRDASYLSPTDLTTAVDVLGRGSGDIDPVAGGTVVLATDRRTPGSTRTVMDLSRLALDQISVGDDHLRLGAAVTYRQLLGGAEVAQHAPLLVRMALEVTGGPQIRNRGTVGGSACFANPASDIPACLLALAAVMLVEGRDGARRIPAEAFFTGAFRTALRPGELLVAIDVPTTDAIQRSGYHKLKLSEGSWPIATAAFVERGSTQLLALGASVPRPALVPLDGPAERLAGADLRVAVEAVLIDVGPWTDELASAGYRTLVAPTVAWRALEEALARPLAPHPGGFAHGA